MVYFLGFFFSIRPTDPISRNASDAKRKKERGWPYYANPNSPELIVFVFSAVATDSPPAGPRLLPRRSKFVRVVFVLSAVASDSAPAGPMLLPESKKFVRVLFALSTVASDSAPTGPILLSDRKKICQSCVCFKR